MADQTNTPATPDLQPGSLAWRITVATLAHQFFHSSMTRTPHN
jgi:hypothetical protein